MSRLFHSESGRVMHLLSEELTRRRRARKVFHLPPGVECGGTLYVFAKARAGRRIPLQVAVNGTGLTAEPIEALYLSWYLVPVPAGVLVGGENVVELWSDNVAMDGWMLGIEGRPENPDSALSLDGGRTWQSERMSIHHCLRGEYVVRLRLDDPSLRDPTPPAMAWENPEHPLLEELRRLIPSDIRDQPDAWRRARRLATWVCGQWRYGSDRGHGIEINEYCPWDPMTILAWRRAEFGQYQPNPVAFCVHFGVVYTMSALAVGIPARCVCGTASTLARKSGHFISEVWMERWANWCHVDPMCDFAFIQDDVPLSTDEVSRLSRAAAAKVLDRGPGLDREPVERQDAWASAYGCGECFRHWAVWARNDFFSRPDLTPPAHGACHYCETNWVWADDGTDADTAMFPYHASAGKLAAPPGA